MFPFPLRALCLVLPGLLLGSCGGGSVCRDPDATIPDVEAGARCTFPCLLARRGDDAGGDTYANFAAPFFSTYCVRCHSTTRNVNCFTEGNTSCRFGAPRGYNWDDPAALARHLPQIRAVVGVGDDLTMPPDIPATPDPAKPDPSCDLRYRMTRWIDSGAPGLPQ